MASLPDTSFTTDCFHPDDILQGCGRSTRLVSADNTICDGHRHAGRRWEDRFIPATILHPKKRMTDLYGKQLPDNDTRTAPDEKATLHIPLFRR